ncbi:MAG: hypothetical protein IJG16_07085 [Clostridia bacterium]|nr:hypothetical protein [Clostridia bacterium]
MLEIYEIVWRNDEVTGYLEYSEEADKFQAYLKDGMRPNPCGLFGVIKKDKVIDDRRVRAYIDSCVVPKTRENIDDILKHMNMPYYDQWEIYKHNKGENVNDYAAIRFFKTVDSKEFLAPNDIQ